MKLPDCGAHCTYIESVLEMNRILNKKCSSIFFLNSEIGNIKEGDKLRILLKLRGEFIYAKTLDYACVPL